MLIFWVEKFFLKVINFLSQLWISNFEVLNLLVSGLDLLLQLGDLLVLHLDMIFWVDYLFFELLEFLLKFAIAKVEVLNLLVFGLNLSLQLVDSLDLQLILVLGLGNVLFKKVDFLLKFADLLQISVSCLAHWSGVNFIFIKDLICNDAFIKIHK